MSNLHKQLYYNYDQAGNMTGVQGDSSGTLGSGLTTTANQYSYNCLNELTGTSAGGPIRFQGTYANPVTSNVVNVSQTMTITAPGGITNGDVITLAVHDKTNSTAKSFSYTINSGTDTSTTLIATHFVSTNSSALSAIGISASSSANVVTLTSTSANVSSYTDSLNSGATEQLALGTSAGNMGTVSPSNTFTANPVLAGGTSSTANTTSVTGVSGGGVDGNSQYSITINSATPSTLTYDYNGNMSTDGTNGYSWDAENRLVRIAYPYGSASASTNVTVGTTPAQVVYSLNGSTAYVANSGSGTVSVINTSSNTVSSSITVGTTPGAMALSPDGTLLYVCNFGSGTVSIISTASNSVLSTVTVGSQPQAVAFNGAGTEAFVANSNAATVSVINVLTSTVTATVTVGTTPYALAVSKDGSQTYVANKGAGTVSVIENSVSATFTIGGTVSASSTETITVNGNTASYTTTGSDTLSSIAAELSAQINQFGITGISAATNGSAIFVYAPAGAIFSDTTQNAITITQGSAPAVSSTITVGTTPFAMAITPNNTEALVVNQGSGTVSVISTSSNTVIATATVGTTPYSIAVTPDGTKAYVSNSGSGTVSVITLATNAVASITVGTTPEALNITSDGLQAYVANSGAGTVSVINTIPNTVASTVTVGTTPNAVAFNPNGTQAYVANSGSANVTPITTGGNNSQMTYDGLGNQVKIVETGSSPSYNGGSTKQFVYCGSQRCEERNSSGTLVTQFFNLGYTNGGNNYYYTLDHLGNKREVYGPSGIVDVISYTPYGVPSLTVGSTLPDFGYAGYYYHSRSGLNMTATRAYSSALSRWINRDRIGEVGGINLYGYVGNNPISFVDPMGTDGESCPAKVPAAPFTPTLPYPQPPIEYPYNPNPTTNQYGIPEPAAGSNPNTSTLNYDPVTGMTDAALQNTMNANNLGGGTPAGGGFAEQLLEEAATEFWLSLPSR